MIKIYSSNSNSATRLVRLFCESNNLEYEVLKVTADTLTYNDFKKLLELSEDGVYALISMRSNAYLELRKSGVVVDDLTLKGIYSLIIENPLLLKTPVTVNFDKHVLVIGRNEEDLVKFISREARSILRRQRMLAYDMPQWLEHNIHSTLDKGAVTEYSSSNNASPSSKTHLPEATREEKAKRRLANKKQLYDIDSGLTLLFHDKEPCKPNTYKQPKPNDNYLKLGK